MCLRFSWVLVFFVFCASCYQTPPRTGPGTAVATAYQVAVSPSASGVSEQAPMGPLPRDVRPLYYELALEVLPEQDRFFGSVKIAVQLTKKRNVIWIHGQGLQIRSARFVPSEGASVPLRWEQVDSQSVAALQANESLNPGDGTIEIEYSGAFGTHLAGLYRVRQGQDAFAYTQFEPISARLAFPCFDEPVFKTPFEIALTIKSQRQAVSNAPLVREENVAHGKKRLHFRQTKPLPTYLVGWAVGPFDFVESLPIAPNAVRSRPLRLRGVAVRGRGAQMKWALEKTGELVAELERYLGIAYPYEKLDLVAVPDFDAGAMENAGVIMFREGFLLLDDASSEEPKRRALYVIAHELAHHWFGNLVTMPWWDEIWLNESFATWAGEKVIRNLYPDQHSELPTLAHMFDAMQNDSVASARAVWQPIEKSHDIRNAFDSAIAYVKGSKILEMFEHWVGDEVFRSGVQSYLRTYAGGTATTENFLAAVSESSHRDVREPFRSFLLQPGVPYLDVKTECDASGAKITVEQTRFAPQGSSVTATRPWQIPLCFAYSANGEIHEKCELIAQDREELHLPNECPQWLLPNAEGYGYFRFSLPTADWNRLRGSAWVTLSDRSKLAVSDGLRASFDTGRLSARDVLRNMEPLSKEASRALVTFPMSTLEFVRDYLSDERGVSQIEATMRRWYAPRGTQLGWVSLPDETGETRLLRARVIEFLALQANDRRVRAEGLRRARLFLGMDTDRALHPEALESDLRDIALSVAVQEGGNEVFERVLDVFSTSTDSSLRTQTLEALSHATGAELSERARGLSLDVRLRVNEVRTPLDVQMSMRETRMATWNWLKEHFDAIAARISTNGAGQLPWLATALCTEEDANDVWSFFAPRVGNLFGGPRNLESALEVIRICAAKVKAQRAEAVH